MRHSLSTGLPRYAFRICFEKTGVMRYISHLDLLRLFQRAARRADLPLMLSEGFNPHPKIKIEPALKLGVESGGLKAEVILTADIPPAQVHERVKKELPDGIRLINTEQINNKEGT